MTTLDLIVLRIAIAREIASAKVDYPNHHAALDLIGNTLDQIGAHLVPDFLSLDRHTDGAVTRLLRQDVRGVAKHGIVSPLITDAGAYLRFNVIFIDKMRTDLNKRLARQTRRMLDRKRLRDA